MNNREFYIHQLEFHIQVSSLTRKNYEKVIYKKCLIYLYGISCCQFFILNKKLIIKLLIKKIFMIFYIKFIVKLIARNSI